MDQVQADTVDHGSGVTRGFGRGADLPGWHPPGGGIRRKKFCGQIYKE